MVFSREQYLKHISDTLSFVQLVFKNRVKLNLYDGNIIAEDFFQGLLNIIYDYKLINLNLGKKNVASIDLGDTVTKVCYQVTITNTKTKIQTTIDKFVKKGLTKQYNRLYILLLRDKLEKYTTFNLHNIVKFDDKKNIFDISDIIEKTKSCPTSKLSDIVEYLKKEVKHVGEAQNLLVQSDKVALENFKSLLNRPALLDPFIYEANMNGFEEAIREIRTCFSIGLIKTSLQAKPVHLFADPTLQSALENIQRKFTQLLQIYRMYISTGEIDPNSNSFFPRNRDNTAKVFDNFREDILKDFNQVLRQHNINEIQTFYKN